MGRRGGVPGRETNGRESRRRGADQWEAEAGRAGGRGAPEARPGTRKTVGAGSRADNLSNPLWHERGHAPPRARAPPTPPPARPCERPAGPAGGFLFLPARGRGGRPGHLPPGPGAVSPASLTRPSAAEAAVAPLLAPREGRARGPAARVCGSRRRRTTWRGRTRGRRRDPRGRRRPHAADPASRRASSPYLSPRRPPPGAGGEAKRAPRGRAARVRPDALPRPSARGCPASPRAARPLLRTCSYPGLQNGC